MMYVICIFFSLNKCISEFNTIYTMVKGPILEKEKEENLVKKSVTLSKGNTTYSVTSQ